MHVETHIGTGLGLQAGDHDAAMKTETTRRTVRPTTPWEQNLAALWLPHSDVIESTVEDAVREGLTAPEVLSLALLALLSLLGLGSMMLVVGVI